MVSKEYVGLLSLILTRGVAQKLVTELFPLGKISLKSINRFVDRHILSATLSSRTSCARGWRLRCCEAAARRRVMEQVLRQQMDRCDHVMMLELLLPDRRLKA